jgi:hypothetical protein
VRSRGLQPHQRVIVVNLYLVAVLVMLAGGPAWLAFGLVMYGNGLWIGRGYWS